MHEPPPSSSDVVAVQASANEAHDKTAATPAAPAPNAGEAPEGTSARKRRREGLQAFQQSLFARMHAASSADLQSRRLAVSIGGVSCLINLADAGEIMPLSSLPMPTPVPLTQPWYLGLVNIRGNLVGIVDLAAQAGMGRQPPGRDSRVLVFAPTLSPNCALLLSSVMGLRQLSDMRAIGKNLDKKPELIGVIERYKDKDGTEWNEIGLATLLSDAAFLQIGR